MCRPLRPLRLLALVALLAGCEDAGRPVAPPDAPQFTHSLGRGLVTPIAFTSTRDGNAEIYVMNADGTGVTRLTNEPRLDAQPAWSPKGKQIAFTSTRDGDDNDIFVMKPNGGRVTRLTDNAVIADDEPAWSPDGRQIAFTRGRAGGFEIHVMNADGTGVTQLTNSAPSNDIQPAWSPDGTRIAFTSNRGEEQFDPPQGSKRFVYLMDASGSNPVKLTTFGLDTDPDWAPDGTEIAFTAQINGDGGDVYAIQPDGTGLRNVSHHNCCDADVDSQPAWSPDRSLIAARRFRFLIRHGEERLSTMDAGGSGQEQQVVPGQARDPSWQALGALDRYPRPGGATPYRVPLVPAFTQCTSPNVTHVAPLSLPSCTPPLLASDVLTTGTVGGAQGSALLKVIPGNPATTADEADVQVSASTSDVRSRPSGSDYAGSLILTTALRITDRQNGFGDVAGTAADTSFSAPFSCVTTPSGGLGSNCSFATTADTLVPGVIAEGKRAVWSILQLRVRDAGPDGDVGPPASCPPTCGTGDEQTFLDQGVFAP